MKSNLLVIVLVVCTASSAAADVTVVEDRKSITVDCARDPNVTVNGNKVTVTLEGTCAKVTVRGNHATVKGSTSTADVAGNSNSLELDRVDAISVPGNKNSVSYRAPIKAEKTKVSNAGKKNSIRQVQ